VKVLNNVVSDADYDPSAEARTVRKARIAKNERQHSQNLARSQQGQTASAHTHTGRKREIERTLTTTRASTASMGKFDRALEGEKKLRGVKRKVVAFHFLVCNAALDNHNLRFFFSFSSTQ